MKSLLSRSQGKDIVAAFGLTAVILFFVLTTFISYRNIQTINANAHQVELTHLTSSALDALLVSMQSVETGQRGYLITGDEKYLAPYTNALPRIDEQLAQIAAYLKSTPEDEKLQLIKKHVDAKLAELAETIALRRTQGFDAALKVVTTDRGKNEMDDVRGYMQDITHDQAIVRDQRISEMDSALHFAIIAGVTAGILGILLTVFVGGMIQRATVARLKDSWLHAGQAGLATATYGETTINQLAESILRYLSDYLGAQAGAFFVKDRGSYDRVATYGVPEDSKTPTQFKPGDGLLGQAVKDNKPFVVTDVPDDYLYFGSALGQSKPRQLIVFPVTAEGIVNSALELGFVSAIDPITMELLEEISEVIGIAVRSAIYRSNLQNLLEETQRQAEEMQTQSEELKVSNEELEEQSRALKEQQIRMEQQQAELEQTNSQLEEQAQTLETQQKDLAESQILIQTKMRELEQASQYKSNFLANMSHELRTPLNASLILAKLLADNASGNLTNEQIMHAKTIQSSGNDLLTLINDILDLSKIEAGHIEIHPDTIALKRLTTELARMFEPMAKTKGLRFKTTIAAHAPENVTSDRQRLEQILKNLVANALKFTAEGEIELSISSPSQGMMAFAVIDTGIGISKDQQEAIFDAFRQADGTISRKYGGTGLGLSISRELTRLLGGRIELTSEPGKGSKFTVIIPEHYHVDQVKAHVQATPRLPPRLPTGLPLEEMPDRQSLALRVNSNIADDRETLADNKRTILIIEDDKNFIDIMRRLVHELDFQCVIVSTAEDGLIAARQYVPHAVLLDIGLPDHSGLLVLDRMKHDVRLRHIPVHVISASDYAQTALSLGAAGYMLKPVKQDQLTDALKGIAARFQQSVRRVLIVEDDDVQREALTKLLNASGVTAVAVGTAGECLELLENNTFDCMVLDLSLPDATGYELLEKLNKEGAYSFPPVIVYTGRELSADEEQRLRRYSKSIIIKGARSPERLLDEVTLFLHQVVSELPPEQQTMLKKAHSRDAALEGKHVLVVEDDVRNVYAVSSILEPHGVKVHIARNGREGLDKLGQLPQVDLILMDVMMPEMDGIEATQAIRTNTKWKNLPVIMLTAKAMKGDQEKCIQAGANDYMAKPLDVEKLLSLVRVWMPR